MRLSIRVGIVVLVVAIALVAAMQFRRPEAPSSSEGWAGGGLDRRLATGSSDGWASRVPSTPLKAEPLRVPTAATESSAEVNASPPELPPSYHRTFSPVGALLNEADETLEDEPQRLEDEAVPAGARALTHKIADGDTLTTLAARYLGDANRWQQLFDENRDVLSNPDLLPIGRVIRIPQGEPAVKEVVSQVEPAPPMTPIPRGAFRQSEF